MNSKGYYHSVNFIRSLHILSRKYNIAASTSKKMTTATMCSQKKRKRMKRESNAHYM